MQTPSLLCLLLCFQAPGPAIKPANPRPLRFGHSLVKGVRPSILTISFSSDGKTIASGGADGSVRTWNCRTGKELAVLGMHPERVRSVVFSQDGKYVASACNDELRIFA